MHKSTIRVGTTEGRFRMIMPSLMRHFKEMYNDYDIRGIIGNAEQLREMLENGELDNTDQLRLLFRMDAKQSILG